MADELEARAVAILAVLKRFRDFEIDPGLGLLDHRPAGLDRIALKAASEYTQRGEPFEIQQDVLEVQVESANPFVNSDFIRKGLFRICGGV
jgi:hypothetical protein